MHIQVNPIAKPRMTQRDKWKQRPSVMKYRAYKDELRLVFSWNNELAPWLIFEIPMPKSWSKKKQKQMLGKPHHQRPDIDNLVKGFLDALLEEDSAVDEIHAKKVWGEKGGIYYGEQYWISKTTKKEEVGQSPVEKQEEAPRGVTRARNPRMRGVSPRVRRG